MRRMNMSDKRIITTAEAIREATAQMMQTDEQVIVVGEGVPDPKGIFGTTIGLRDEFGERRVFDMPVAENGMTGAIIGAALSGMKPILTHQRVDFALLSLDQIINNAAKWYFMFGEQQSVPIVIRMVIGHGWGQGAQHSQNLHALFGHIPGLKVVMPSTAYDAKGLLISSIQDPNPVIFLEHRWIHNLVDHVPSEIYTVPIGKANILQEGTDVTIVSASYMAIESLRAAQVLQKEGINAEVIDLRTVTPLDEETILTSVKKTGRLIVVDSAWSHLGLAGEIIARVATNAFDSLKEKPKRITLPDMPSPSSSALTKHYYPTYRTIAEDVASNIGKAVDVYQTRWKQEDAENPVPHDVPDKHFMGPF